MESPAMYLGLLTGIILGLIYYVYDDWQTDLKYKKRKQEFKQKHGV